MSKNCSRSFSVAPGHAYYKLSVSSYIALSLLKAFKTDCCDLLDIKGISEAFNLLESRVSDTLDITSLSGCIVDDFVLVDVVPD